MYACYRRSKALQSLSFLLYKVIPSLNKISYLILSYFILSYLTLLIHVRQSSHLPNEKSTLFFNSPRVVRIAGVGKSRTNSYHHIGNDQVERFNKTLLQMLHWKITRKVIGKHNIPTLVHPYNATFHDSTGYSPIFLMFGRHPRLAIDAFLGLKPDAMSAPTQTDYVRKLKERLHFAYKTAQEMAKKAAARDKINYNLKARNSVLSLCDLVLVKNVGLRGKHKIADMWEHKSYVVVFQPYPDIPVYEVKYTSTRQRKTRLLLRILLLPFMGLLRVEQSEETENVPSSTEHIGTSPNNSPVSIPDNYFSSESSSGLSSGGSYSSDDESSMSETGRTEQVIGKYVPPRHRKPGQFGLLPRTKSIPTTTDTGSSSEDDISQRPGRTRKLLPWMRTGDWVVGQQYTLTVDPSEVAHI